MRQSYFGELVAEAIGSFILLFIGAGTVAAVKLNSAFTGMWQISILWGLAVMVAIYVTGAVSGTHINPAVTVSLAIYRGFSWGKVIPYTLAQMIGTFTGAAVAYGLYRGAFSHFEAANHIVRGSAQSVATAGIFSTYPQPYLSNWDAFLIEFVITALLLVVILAVTDAKNSGAPLGNMAPLIIGLTIAMIGGSYGSLTGFALNPARDLGPKLFASLAGWGSIGFPGPNGYAWVPVFGPLSGAILGGAVYDFGVRRYLPAIMGRRESVAAADGVVKKA